MNRLHAVLVLLLAPGLRLSDAQNAGAQLTRPRDVMVLVEMIEVRDGQLTGLLSDPDLGRDGTKLRERLQGMVRAGEVRLHETLAVRVQAGSKSDLASVREWIYPTEWEPPELQTNSGTGLGQANRGVGNAEVPTVPTAFETREAGSGLEVEAFLSEDERTVKLRWAISLVTMAKINSFGKRVTPTGNELDLTMPEFAAMEPKGEIAIPDGGYVLAAVGQRDPAEKARLLVMIRCDLLR